MTPEIQQRFPAVSVNLRNGEMVTLRPLSDDDGESLAAFYEGIPREDIRFYCPHPLDREHAFANAEKASEPNLAVIVLETPDRQVGGYAWFRWREADAEKSHFGICVRRDYQGLGAGHALMSRLMKVSAEVGPSVMCLTVQLANDRAVALYRKMGFLVVREGTREAFAEFPAEPQYWMERQCR